MNTKKDFGEFFGRIEIIELSEHDESYLEAYAEGVELNVDAVDKLY